MQEVHAREVLRPRARGPSRISPLFFRRVCLLPHTHPHRSTCSCGTRGAGANKRLMCCLLSFFPSRSERAREGQMLPAATTAATTREHVCNICAQLDEARALASCGSCGARVHLECYQLLAPGAAATADDFVCQACAAAAAAAATAMAAEASQELKPDVAPKTCALCGRGGSAGLFVATAEGAWVHGVCGRFVPGVSLMPAEASAAEGGAAPRALVAYGVPGARARAEHAVPQLRKPPTPAATAESSRQPRLPAASAGGGGGSGGGAASSGPLCRARATRAAHGHSATSAAATSAAATRRDRRARRVHRPLPPPPRTLPAPRRRGRRPRRRRRRRCRRRRRGRRRR